MRILLATAVALAALSSGAGGSAADTTLRVLFVGNSLTAANDLPALVHALAAVSAGPAIETGAVTPGGYALEDHWTNGEARHALDSGDWDVVVLQQGPSSLPESRTNLVEWSKRWADDARAHNVRPAMLTVWPEQYRASYAFAAVVQSYRVAALESGSLLLPAGAAWRIALQKTPKLRLFGPDGFHPSPLGSYLAAIVVYSGLTGHVPATLPRALGDARTSAQQLKLLRTAAALALASR